MKKLIYLLVCLCTIVLSTSCNKIRGVDAPAALDTTDSILVSNCIYEYFNPVFTDVQEVLDFQEGIINDAKIDSFIGTIDREKLRYVATVFLKKGEPVTLRALYKEYMENKDIYDNLPLNATTPNVGTIQQPSTTTVEESQDRVEKPVSTTTHVKDTTIDGKKVSIETKTITYE